MFFQEMDIIKKQGAKPLRDYCTTVGDVSANKPAPLPAPSASVPKKKGKSVQLKLPDGTYPYSAHVLVSKRIGLYRLSSGEKTCCLHMHCAVQF